VLWGLLATLWGEAGTARADTLTTDVRGYAQGRLLSGVVSLAGKQVPLPDGSWILAGNADTTVDAVDGAYGAIANLVLFRLQGHVVDAALELNVNELPVTDGWGLSADCDRTDLVLAVVRYRTGWDGSCFFVTHSLAVTPLLPPAWEQALRFAADADLIMAPVWVTAGFRVANRRDLVDARFQFSPALRGVPVEIVSHWEDSAWYGQRLQADPRRLALATEVARWADHYGGWLEDGLKRRLDPTLKVPMPGSGAATSVLQQRLVRLSEQRASGLLEEEPYQRQVRWLHDNGIHPGSQVTDSRTVALGKALSYQPILVLGSLAAWFAGGAPILVEGVLGMLRVGLDTAVFYAHELGWERLAGQPRRDSARIVDFRYFGDHA
jgi:uncharacterized membrane protein